MLKFDWLTISLARSEKALAPGVGQWDLSAPDHTISNDIMPPY